MMNVENTKSIDKSHTCIFCKKVFNYSEEEHIIPDCILYKPNNRISIFDVCKICNNTFGGTIDDEFINDDFIKAIRILHRDFIKANKNPKLIFSNITSIMIGENKIYLNLTIDKKGNHLSISKKLIKTNGIMTTFLEANEVNKFIKKHKSKILSITKIEFKPILDIELKTILLNKIKPENFSIVFPRYFIKMALEYICFKFGSRLALDSKFDRYRDLSNRVTDNFDCMKRVVLRVDVSYDPVKLEYVQHTIGLNYNNDIKKWVFYFYYFNIVEFYVSLPPDDIFTECVDYVTNSR